jgi:hypothetical protein
VTMSTCMQMRIYCAIVVGLAGLLGCASIKQMLPNQYKGLMPPPSVKLLSNGEPLEGNGGKYMCPYTSDSTVAPWVEKGIAAKIGSTVGGISGSLAGSRLANNSQYIDNGAGAAIGNIVGGNAGRKIALSLVGGEQYMKETSDLSFNSIDDMIVFMYRNYRTNEHFDKVIDLVGNIYPDFASRRDIVIQSMGIL